jgi:hypothetical protein
MKNAERVRPMWLSLLLVPIAVLGLTANSHSAGHAIWWWALLVVGLSGIAAYWIAIRRWKKAA